MVPHERSIAALARGPMFGWLRRLAPNGKRDVAVNSRFHLARPLASGKTDVVDLASRRQALQGSAAARLHRLRCPSKESSMFAVRYLSRLAATGLAIFLCFGGDRAEAIYDVEPGEISGKPGTLIRVWPLKSGGPGNSNAFRFLYRSTGPKGEVIPVSGAIFIPTGPAPSGGRNIIAWAHPTSGVALSWPRH